MVTAEANTVNPNAWIKTHNTDTKKEYDRIDIKHLLSSLPIL